MPPKKKNKEEKSSAAATTPTPGSATNPESAEDRQNELTANFDSIVDDFTEGFKYTVSKVSIFLDCDITHYLYHQLLSRIGISPL